MEDREDEVFPLVDESGKVIGQATRAVCHAKTFLLHPVIHLHVFNSEGKLYLQKRSSKKDVQPDKWDTSVGGHVDLGEAVEDAVKREAFEELAITEFQAHFLFRHKIVTDLEAELTSVFYTVFDGEISPDPTEISEGRFWDVKEIAMQIGQNIFTPNFERDFEGLLKMKLIHLDA